MKEFRVKVTVRNNLLLTAIANNGYKSQSDFARACGLYASKVNALVAFRAFPIKMDGEFTDDARIIMETLGACPSDLWTTEQLSMRLKNSYSEMNLSKAELLPVLGMNPIDMIEFKTPDEYLEDKDQEKVLAAQLDTLTEREREVLIRRYGFNGTAGFTLRAVGEELGLTQERVRQLEAKALRKLRHGDRLLAIKEIL